MWPFTISTVEQRYRYWTTINGDLSSNLNYGSYMYNSSGATKSCSNCSSYAEQNYSDEEVTKMPQSKTKSLSRMSIDFMLDNDDEEYESATLSSTTTDARERRSSKDAPGIVDVYTPVMKDPAAILRSNDSSATTSPIYSVSPNASSTLDSQFSTVSLIELNESTFDVNPKIKEKASVNRQRTRMIHSGVIKAERKRKGNSLARVMIDRGLFKSIFNFDITSTVIKSVRIPPPPPMQHNELVAAIKELNINHSILDDYTPDITWKRQPLNITHLPHYKELHEIETKVVSTLRLTPVQYLTGKHTLLSAARRYDQKALPFKKSDAQKLLRIDVNKASKLWEFFRQVKWI